MVPAEATAADIAFAQRHLDLHPPAHILDIPCGAGRHALALADVGYRVTGVDLSQEAVARAGAAGRERGLSAVFVHGDMRDFEAEGPFDGIICLGNSISYFDPPGTGLFLRSLAAKLRPGGRLILDTHCCAESLFPLQAERRLDFDGGCYESRLSYDPMTSRLRTVAEL